MKILRLSLIILLLFVSNTTLADDNRPKLVVFGDSLSDMGNFYTLTALLNFEPPIPPSEDPFLTFWEGRFSNGPIWAEYLAQHLEVDIEASTLVRSQSYPQGINFAWGGATSKIANINPGGILVPGLIGQVQLYNLRFVKNRRISKDTIHGIWIGADDILLGFSTNSEQISDVVDNIVTGIQRLHRRGARRFLIANLPELCALSLPEAETIPGCDSQPTLTQLFNETLLQAIQKLAKKHKNSQFYLADIYTAAIEVFTQLPPVPGPASGCLFSLPAEPQFCTPEVTGISEDMLGPNASFFDGPLWDEEHPTTFVHQIITGVMLDALENPM